MANIFNKKILKTLANLQFAIGLLFTLGLVIALGTIIEQDQKLGFYQENYPDITPLFGILNWQVILFFNLDKIYSAWWFLLILFLFGASLLACTFTTQLPSIKTFKLWKFVTSPLQSKNLVVKDQLDLQYANTFVYNCNENTYHVFRQRKKGYAYSGLLGRIGPIVVHGSIILLLIGSTLGSFQGYIAQEMIARGEIFHIQNLTKFGNLSYISQDFSCRINNFWITYTKGLKIDQFYSDVSFLDPVGKELKRKTLFVNEPSIFNGVTFYQTDWDILGLKLRLNDNQVLQIPLKKIAKGGRNFWLGSLNLDNGEKNSLTLVINDLTGKIYCYTSKGVLLKELMIGDSITLEEDYKIQFLDYLTTTGLQIKLDPGIPVVYFSFFLLMLSIYVSFFTYSQIWLIEDTSIISVGGKSNRAVLFFQEEFKKILKRSMN
jgi:cytochrome c biogenesis protein